MRARTFRTSLVAAVVAGLVGGALGGADRARAQTSAWHFEASEGLCSGFYSPDGQAAHGFSWSPSGELAWSFLQRNGPKESVRLHVTAATGDDFAGTAEPDDGKELRAYALVGSDRRNARLMLSGDVVFSYQLAGHRVEQVVPLGLQSPKVAACMAQARDQVAKGEVAEAPRGGERRESGDGQLRVIATGSGVFVDAKGSLVTNAHVVNECRAVGSRGFGEAEVVAIDEASDLALLRFKRIGAFARLRESGVRLGEPVTAAGFPLQSVLANGLNITAGNVSALAGVGGDRRFIQISAPVQPGNSGGALLDASGRLVGIVEARLKREAGDPQNINFAVAPYVVGAFLRENGVVLAAPIAPVQDVAALARQFTIQLECAA